MTRTKALLVVLFIVLVSTAYADVRVFQLSGPVARQQHTLEAEQAAQNAQLRQLKTVQAAVCSFREDLHRRYVSGVVFVEQHPDGIPGISRATIEVSLKGQASTLKALKPLVC